MVCLVGVHIDLISGSSFASARGGGQSARLRLTLHQVVDVGVRTAVAHSIATSSGRAIGCRSKRHRRVQNGGFAGWRLRGKGLPLRTTTG